MSVRWSNRELAQIVRGTVEASEAEREMAMDLLQSRGYEQGTLHDLAGPWPLEEVHPDFAEA